MFPTLIAQFWGVGENACLSYMFQLTGVTSSVVFCCCLFPASICCSSSAVAVTSGYLSHFTSILAGLFWPLASAGFLARECEHFLSFFEHLLWTNGHEICRFIIIQITQTRMAVLKRKYLFFSQPTLFSVMEEQQPIPAAIGQAEVHAVLKIHAHEGRACKPERSNSTNTQTSDCHVVRHEH